MARKAQLVSLALAIAAVACSGKSADSNPTNSVASQAGFDSAASQLLAALRIDQADTVLALMAEAVILMPPHEPVLRGKAAVRTWYDQFLTQVRTAGLTISDREVRMGGDWVTEVSGYEWTLSPVAGGAPIIERGNYIQLWHREGDGRYLLVRELWNSTSPLPAN